MPSGKEKYCRALDNMCKENPIICIKTYDTVEKATALNHMLKKGWICVQNDTCHDGHIMGYALTFADKDAAASFKV